MLYGPSLCPQALAARLRPESLPAYEVLYKSAEELAVKREEQRRMAEEARLKVCLCGGKAGGPRPGTRVPIWQQVKIRA